MGRESSAPEPKLICHESVTSTLVASVTRYSDRYPLASLRIKEAGSPGWRVSTKMVLLTFSVESAYLAPTFHIPDFFVERILLDLMVARGGLEPPTPAL